MICADTVQSAQERFCTTAWSLPSRSDSARGVVALVCHDPETTRQLDPRPVARLKPSENRTPEPASGGPASGGPASGGPASGGPASGVPASGEPASGVPPSVPPAGAPVTVNLPNQIPARLVQIPAVPATRMADGDESLTTSFVTPSTDATRFTGFEPVAESAMATHQPRSAIPLGASPSTVTVAPLCRRIWRLPFASSATSYRSFENCWRRSSSATPAEKLITCADTLQSAQERFCTTAWSLPSRSDSARGLLALVCHEPETICQFGPSPLARLKSSLKRTPDCGGGVPASGAPASGAPASGAPASGAPASGAPASGAPASGAPASGA